MAKKSGVRDDDVSSDEIEDGEDRDDDRDVLGSMRGVRSVASSWSESEGSAAVVRIVGSVLGARRGERGGVSAGKAILPADTYSTTCVCEFIESQG